MNAFGIRQSKIVKRVVVGDTAGKELMALLNAFVSVYMVQYFSFTDAIILITIIYQIVVGKHGWLTSILKLTVLKRKITAD